MRFLLDQDVYAATARFLAGLGHDVAQAAQMGLAEATDVQLLAVAQEQGRILVTRDRDLGRWSLSTCWEQASFTCGCYLRPRILSTLSLGVYYSHIPPMR